MLIQKKLGLAAGVCPSATKFLNAISIKYGYSVYILPCKLNIQP